MALHVNLTFAILFANIFLALGAPQEVIGDNAFFTTNAQGDYVVKSNFQSTLVDSNPGKGDSGLDAGSGFFSGLFLIFDFIGLLFTILFSTLTILPQLPSLVALMVGIPVFIAYGLAIIGFIRG